jgi:hypothetical protein
MNNEQLQSIFDYVDKVTLKLGTEAEHIWPWFIRQQYVEAIFFGIGFLVCMAATILLTKYMCSHWAPKNKDEGYYSIYENDHEGMWIVFMVLSCVTTVIFFAIAAIEIPDIFNPQYAALKSFLHTFKP